MILEGNTIQEEEPTPDNPAPIVTGVEVLMNGGTMKKILPLDKFILSPGDYIQEINGTWYLIKKKVGK